MRVALIHNANSGDEDHSLEDLVDLIRRAGHDVSHFRSKSSWETELDSDTALLVAAGGDGTVIEVARTTVARDVPIAILPIGTANNIATALGLTGVSLEELISGWQRPVLRPFDIGISRGPWDTCMFLESVGVGLLTTMMSEIDAGGSRYVNRLDGRDARIDAALEVLGRLLERSRTVHCEVEIDDRRFCGEYLLVEVLNFGIAGPNLRLSGRANAADGLLDVVLVTERERTVLEEHLSVIRGDPQHLPALPVEHGRHVRLRFERCDVHLDDTVWRGPAAGTPVVADVDIEPGALTFVGRRDP